MSGRHVPQEIRAQIFDFVGEWSEKTEKTQEEWLGWMQLKRSTFFIWKTRYQQPNEHNAKQPRGHWLLEEEKQAILEFALKHPEEGYRRLCYMMLDADVAAVSSASVYRVLKQEGLLSRSGSSTSQKGTGFDHPTAPHEHWHIDICYLNLSGTFYYMIYLLDGYSRYIVHWELKESMTEADVELTVERARELYPGVAPRLISDNEPQFLAKDFKQYIQAVGMTHMRTSPYYPPSNGKQERFSRPTRKNAFVLKRR